MKIIYLGNQLSSHGYTPTSVETLGDRMKEIVQVVQASSRKNKLLRLLDMWWTTIRNKDARYVVIDTYSSSAFIFSWTSARLAKWLRIPYIPILHGGSLPERAKRSPQKVKRLLDDAHTVVCPSNYLKSAMEAAIGGEYKLIPNFVELEHYPIEPKVLNKEQGFKILWVRSFHEIYNAPLAVKFLHALLEKGYPAELCMIGPDKDGSLAKVKELAAELGVSKQLSTPGLMPKADWIEHSRSFNLFINTTNVDNTPVSVMEAMALGFPIITTNVGGLPFLLEDQKEGILVEPDQVDRFTEAAIGLLEDPKGTQELCSNARKKAETWDWKAVKAKWSSIFQ